MHLATVVSDDATLITPDAGKGIRLTWLYLGTPRSQDQAIATLSFDTDDVYVVPLPSPGIFMHRGVRKGAADVPLTIALDAPRTVYVNVEYELV